MDSIKILRVALPIVTQVLGPSGVWVNVGSKNMLPIMTHCKGIIDIAIILEENWTFISNPDLYCIVMLIRAHVFEPHVFCSTSIQTPSIGGLYLCL